MVPEMERQESGFFSFQTMFSPAFIKVIYIIGGIGITLAGIGWIVLSLMMIGSSIDRGRFSGSYGNINPFFALLVGLLVLIVGNMIWRVVCEGWIVIFKIYDTLKALERNQKKE